MFLKKLQLAFLMLLELVVVSYSIFLVFNSYNSLMYFLQHAENLNLQSAEGKEFFIRTQVFRLGFSSITLFALFLTFYRGIEHMFKYSFSMLAGLFGSFAFTLLLFSSSGTSVFIFFFVSANVACLLGAIVITLNIGSWFKASA